MVVHLALLSCSLGGGLSDYQKNWHRASMFPFATASACGEFVVAAFHTSAYFLVHFLICALAFSLVLLIFHLSVSP